jgi:hypothetical protein
MTVMGTWRTNADGDNPMLVSGATSVSGGRPQTICTIVFEDTRPTVPFMGPSASLRTKMHEVRAARATDMTLQMKLDARRRRRVVHAAHGMPDVT